MKNYRDLAIRTENQDFDGIGQRLLANKAKVLEALNNAIKCAQELDSVVKKTCYYGKEPKVVKVPQFDIHSLDVSKLNDASFIRLLHGFMGIATEAGEGLEALAKAYNGEQLDKVNVGEELGDVFWYSAIVADTCQTTFEQEQAKNIAKLAKRYGEKFSDVKSMNRDLDAERKILEANTDEKK